MAQIKTTDIINGQEVSAEVQKVVKSLNELMKQLGSLSVQYQKSTVNSKKLTEAEKESARIAKEEAAAIRKHEAERKKLQLAFDKQAAAQRKLVASANMEIKTRADLATKLKAQIQLQGQLNQNIPREKAMYDKLTTSIRHMQENLTKANRANLNFRDNVGNYPQGMGQATKATGGFTKGLAAMAAGLTVALAALRRVSQHIKQSIDLFLEQDKVNRQVQNVFGDYGSAINKAANETQKFTTVGNEQYQKLAIQMKNFGIANSDINESVQGTIGLAEKYATVGLSHETALKGVALAMNGNY